MVLTRKRSSLAELLAPLHMRLVTPFERVGGSSVAEDVYVFSASEPALFARLLLTSTPSDSLGVCSTACQKGDRTSGLDTSDLDLDRGHSSQSPTSASPRARRLRISPAKLSFNEDVPQGSFPSPARARSPVKPRRRKD